MTDEPPGWPHACGPMAARLRDHDWGRTPLGPIACWSYRLRGLVDVMLASPLPQHLVCGTDRILLYNDATADVIGAMHPDAFGGPADTLATLFRPGLTAVYDDAFTGRSMCVNACRIAPDGTGAPDAFDLFLTPVCEDDGSVSYVLGTGIDITDRLAAEAERRRVETELQRREAIFQAIATIGVVKTYRMSADWGRMDVLDSRTLAIAAQPIPNWADRYILPEDRALVQAAIDRAIATRSPFELEHRIRLADGGIGWVHSRAVPILTRDGEIAEWFGAGTDVTERHRVIEDRQAIEARRRDDLERQVQARTAELKESRDLLQATMDSSLDMIQVFEAVRDVAGRIVDFRWVLNNHASTRWFGGVIGERLLEKNPGVVAEGIFDMFCRVVETGMSEQSERHYVHEQFDGWFFQSAVKLGDGVATNTKDITDWKATQAQVLHLREEIAETRLRESEARLAAVFEALPVGVVVADRNGETILANAQLRRFLPKGIVPSCDTERVWRWAAWDETGQRITPQDFPGARALRGETVVPGVDMLYTDNDGREIWTNVTAAPIRDDYGDVIGQVGVIHDIDALKRNAEARQESDERLRQFGEASQDVLWIRDAQTMQWNYLTPAFEAIYGLSRDEALSGDNYRSWLELIVPEDRGAAEDAIRRVGQGEHVIFEYRIRRPRDGAIRWLRNTDFPIVDPNGEVTLIGGIGEDITEAKLAQEAIEQSEERLRSAVEVGRLGLWDWNIPADTIHWSDEHFRMEGYAVNEIRPSYEAWAARLHPDDSAVTRAALKHAMDTGEEYVREFRVVHPDGAIRWLSGRGRFFYDDDGRPDRMIGAMVDMTDHKALEQRQTVLVAELQHRTRNLLGVVRSLADKTARTSEDLADFRGRFRDRLEALSRVQGLLSRLDKHDRVAFDELIATEFSAIHGDTDRVTLAGPVGVRLRSSTVQTLAMALHELATNAVKYGALGQPQAHLSVRWRLEPAVDGDRPWLTIDWREQGVVMPPADDLARGTGQGRELIEQALPYQLSARTTYRLEPTGVHCTIAIPVSSHPPEGNRP